MATRKTQLERLHQQFDELLDRLRVRTESPPKVFELICEEDWDDDRIRVELTAKYPGEYPSGPNDKTILWRIVRPPDYEAVWYGRSTANKPDPIANGRFRNGV